MKRLKQISLLTKIQIALLLGAIGLLLIPVISSYYFVTHNYDVIADFVGHETTTEEFDQYEEYNNSITDANFYTEDPFSRYEVVETNEPKTVGVLHIPQLGEELAIYEDTNDQTLAKGVGLLAGTHYPTGGLNQTTVVTGHRGTRDATIFQNIDKLEVGDVFWVDNGVDNLYYEIYDSVIALPHQTDLLRIVPEQDTFILLSCETPDIKKGLNTHRILLFAKRVEAPTEDLNPDSKVDNQLKFKVLAGIAMILFLTIVVIIIKEVKKTN